MIELKKVSKAFTEESTQIIAVSDISLIIQDGDIFGIIGFSGAGKSTLIRCINLLERPTVDQVWIDDLGITALKGRELREARKSLPINTDRKSFSR